MSLLFGQAFDEPTGRAQPRPEQACSEWAESMQAAAYAWRDVAWAALDPAGYSDPLDRTPAERARTGEDRLRRAEQVTGCSIVPEGSFPPPF